MKYTVTRTHTEKYAATVEADSVQEAIEKAVALDPGEFEHVESGPYGFICQNRRTLKEIRKMVSRGKLKEILKKDSRYKGFTLLDQAVKVKDFLKDIDVKCVQLHSAQIYNTADGYNIVGFCGAFEWKNNNIIPLDHDSYSKETYILGYEWWSNKDIDKGLDILVGDDW